MSCDLSEVGEDLATVDRRGRGLCASDEPRNEPVFARFLHVFAQIGLIMKERGDILEARNLAVRHSFLDVLSFMAPKWMRHEHFLLVFALFSRRKRCVWS